ncbi:VanW family protein [Deinococcus multiflagellatus]|uniref:VanW family protein n=1 Tax=Deinococcus multiflagellatus TaxID=1656887 RepID=UPI001CCEB56B|nr:VanW family protein [Deinococcus multiflagellatus]MBZ9716100.1 VanW family protein [Deinococcus multiflagellatus]
MKRWAGGLMGATLVGGALAVGVATQPGGTLAPGLRIAGVEVGGLTREQAQAALAGQVAAPPQVTVRAGTARWTVGAAQLGWQADTARSLDAAFEATASRNLLQKVQGLIGQAPVQDLPLSVTVDTAQARATLSGLTAALNTQPKNAAIFFDKATKKYAVKPGNPGRQADVTAAVNSYAANPAQTALTVPVKQWAAKYTAAALQAHVDRGNALNRAFTVSLDGTDRTGVLSALQVANLYWVREQGVVPDEQTLKAAFGLLTETVDRPAQNARYVMQGGTLVKAKERAGRVTDRAAAYALFRKAVLDPTQKTLVFPSKVQQPTLTIDKLPAADKLQLIAVGKSTYYGSSPARRTNVANAAAKINGTVVPAGEDFSFLSALGGITPQNGFVGGLIISGGRTVDGLGGGVCQVSTTVFRALYSAGLPVVERNQHSYRVGYYEPQVGFEAAVYDPGLDLKLKNDTSGPILIKTVNNNATSTLEVQVWGIKPARTVTVSPAVITARIPHPAPQYVVNPALRPGTTRQVDWAADGYSLYITRTIKDASGVRQDQVKTVYKPWRAVYETGPRG